MDPSLTNTIDLNKMQNMAAVKTGVTVAEWTPENHTFANNTSTQATNPTEAMSAMWLRSPQVWVSIQR